MDTVNVTAKFEVLQ